MLQVGLKVSAILTACIYGVVAVLPLPHLQPHALWTCPPDQWFWQLMSMCVPKAMPANLPPNPQGRICPLLSYWSGTRYCVPTNPHRSICPFGTTPNSALLYCVPPPDPPPVPCNRLTEWLWKDKGVCMPNSRKAYAGFMEPVPEGYKCPKSWGWNNSLNHCGPFNARQVSKRCPVGFLWDKVSFMCETYPTDNPGRGPCDAGQWFWYAQKMCVTTKPVNREVDTGDIKCPRSWYLHEGGYCVPPSPRSIGNRCPGGYKLDTALLVCVHE